FAHPPIVPRHGPVGSETSSGSGGLPKGRSVPGGCVWFAENHQDGEEALTTIRANCPSCGDVQLTADDLTVRVCSDDERGSYCFRCPHCRPAGAQEAHTPIRDSPR